MNTVCRWKSKNLTPQADRVVDLLELSRTGVTFTLLIGTLDGDHLLVNFDHHEFLKLLAQFKQYGPQES